MPRTFNLLRTLGRGAHGTVHLAELRDEEDYVQTLAIKRLLPEWSGDRDLVARLKDEAKVLAFLHHDHVVRVHGLTRIDGALAILMEPVDGQDLGKISAKSGRMEPKVALGIVEAVADALDAAWCTVPQGHEHPLAVVHRDIKPSNVMLTPRGGVKVMDFGVARAVFDAREGETRSQQFGTARYMAPERWLHGSAVHESDVFSLGVTLIELVSGESVPRLRLSPEAFAQDIEDALSGIAWEPLRALASKMTAFHVEDRPTAAAVATECRALLGTAPGPSLREWAAEHVSQAPEEMLDPTCTVTVMKEDTASRSESVVKQPPDPGLSALPPDRQRFFISPTAIAAVLSLSILLLAMARWTGTIGPAIAPAPAIPAQPTPGPSLPSSNQPGPMHPSPSAPYPTQPDPLPELSPEPFQAVAVPPIEPQPAPQPALVRPKPQPPEPEPDPLPQKRFVSVSFRLDGVKSIRVPAIDKRISTSRVLDLPENSTVDIEVDEPEVGTWHCTIAVGDRRGQLLTIKKRANGGCE